MGAKILYGRPIADGLLNDARKRAREHGVSPRLSIIKTSSAGAQDTYIRQKVKASASIGGEATVYDLMGADEGELLTTIGRLNKDPSVHGIVVQLPLPTNFSMPRVLETISPEKDVDGLHPLNLGRLLAGDESRPPSTALAVVKLLEHYEVGLEGSDVLILNNSLLIGRPLFAMLTVRMATVQVCHIKTEGLKEKISKAEILISATGVPKIINGNMIAEGSVVVDVGAGILNGKVVGDIDLEGVSEKASAISPVPGGVGPITVAILIRNLTESALRSNQR